MCFNSIVFLLLLTTRMKVRRKKRRQKKQRDQRWKNVPTSQLINNLDIELDAMESTLMSFTDMFHEALHTVDGDNITAATNNGKGVHNNVISKRGDVRIEVDEGKSNESNNDNSVVESKYYEINDTDNQSSIDSNPNFEEAVQQSQAPTIFIDNNNIVDVNKSANGIDGGDSFISYATSESSSEIDDEAKNSDKKEV